MKCSRLTISIVTGSLLWAGGLTALAGQGQGSGQSAQTPEQSLLPEPIAVTESLGGQQERDELLQLRNRLCQNLNMVTSIYMNTGVLLKVGAQMENITGLKMEQIQNRQAQACSQVESSQDITKTKVFNQIKTIEWLNRVHTAAMVHVTDRNPQLRPLAADGAEADFFRVHDVIIKEMVKRSIALRTGEFNLQEARDMKQLWDIVAKHEQAEDKVLYPLIETIGNETIANSLKLLSQEHERITAKINAYENLLKQVEAGKEPAVKLFRSASDIRHLLSLHFAKEEQFVARPLMSLEGTRSYFREVVQEHDYQIGEWLKQRGWQCETCQPQ
jgi:hemerythrin-like domain-containing protein